MTSSNVVADAVVWTLAAIVIVCCVLRLFGRLIINNIAGLDDVVVAFATFHHVAATIVFTFANAHGLSVHMGAISSDQLPDTIKLSLVETSMAIMDITISKVALAVLLARLLLPSRRIKWLLIGASLVLVLCGVITVLLTFCQCAPIYGQWNDPQRTFTSCWSPHVILDLGIFTGSYAAALDFVFAAYPACVFAKLPLPLSKKLGVCIVMGVGVIAGAVAVYKVSLIPSLAARGDLAHAASNMTMLTLVEASVCLIAACAPTLGVYRFIFKSKEERKLLGSCGHARWPTVDDLPDFKELMNKTSDLECRAIFVTKHVQVTTDREQPKPEGWIERGFDERWRMPPPAYRTGQDSAV